MDNPYGCTIAQIETVLPKTSEFTTCYCQKGQDRSIELDSDYEVCFLSDTVVASADAWHSVSVSVTGSLLATLSAAALFL